MMYSETFGAALNLRERATIRYSHLARLSYITRPIHIQITNAWQ